MILIAVDIVIGIGLDKMRDKASGNTESSRHRYLAMEAEAPVVVFGSSRAFHHYFSPAMEEELGEKVVNAGEDGNGVILAYGRLALMTERFTPKIALIDIEPGFDIGSDDNLRYLKPLRPFYDASPRVREMFAELSANEPLKMLSHSYRYNSLLPNLLKSSVNRDSLTDYELLDKQVEDFDLKAVNDPPIIREYDPVKRRYLVKFIEECRRLGVMPVIAFSPHYGRTDSDELRPVKELARQYNVIVLDYYADPNFVNDKTLFVDPYHLNSKGAEAYSRTIAWELKPLLQQSK